MKKFVLTTLFALFILFGFNETAYASESNGVIPCVYYKDLMNLRIEDTYSYEEVLIDMQRNNLISQEDIDSFKANHLDMERVDTTETIRYSKFTMDSYKFTDEYNEYKEYVLTPIFYVGLLYRNDSPSPQKIVSLESPYIYTGAGEDCKFDGSIFYRLETGNSFYYGVNGDVYKTGNVSMTAGIKVGIGESANAYFEVTFSNNFLENVSFDGRYKSAGLDPE
jgi:hypothetical protein